MKRDIKKYMSGLVEAYDRSADWRSYVDIQFRLERLALECGFQIVDTDSGELMICALGDGEQQRFVSLADRLRLGRLLVRLDVQTARTWCS